MGGGYKDLLSLVRKLIGRTTWFRSKRKGNKKELYGNRNGAKPGLGGAKGSTGTSLTQRSVLFVQQTRKGELSRRLRELMSRIAPIIGFNVKIVERTGSTLGSKFPQASL